MNISYRVAWYAFHVMYGFWLRARYIDVDNVPKTGPVILASNHASIIDPPLVGIGPTREVCYLARQTLFRSPIVGAILRSWNAIPVDRDVGGKGLKIILNRLKTGKAILLFPEGTRTLDGSLLPARSGIGLTVIKSEAPVVPVRVAGTFEAFNRFHFFPRPHRVMAKYGKPMDFKALRDEAKTCSRERLKEVYQEVADEIMAAIAAIDPCVEKKTFP